MARRREWRDREGRVDDYRLRAQQGLPLEEGEDQQAGAPVRAPLAPRPAACGQKPRVQGAAKAKAEAAAQEQTQAEQALRALPELGEVLISPTELMAYLGVSRRTLWLWIATGR